MQEIAKVFGRIMEVGDHVGGPAAGQCGVAIEADCGADGGELEGMVRIPLTREQVREIAPHVYGDAVLTVHLADESGE